MLIVLAKAPVAGRVKTRLCPPCSAEQAARLAEAALADTLEAAAVVPAGRRVLVLDGQPGPWLPAGFDIVRQRGAGLDERLASAFADTAERWGVRPGLLIGMDTPQVTPAGLAAALGHLVAPGTDAVLGPADDGGWWALGLRHPDPAALIGVPMSTSGTGRAQLRRLEHLGLTVRALPRLRDVDTIADARAVAAGIPASRFAGVLAALGPLPERPVPVTAAPAR